MATRDAQKAAVDKVVKLFHNAKSSTISQQQAATSRDRGVKGPVWVSRVTHPPPEDIDARAHFLEAIAGISRGDEAFTLPSYGPVQGEWVGRRHGVEAKTPEPACSEQEKFKSLMNDCTSDITIMYLHGGAYAFGSPVMARPATIPLSTLTGGRCFALKYRLGPQAQALAPQLDVFVGYLWLLYPPAGALHKPVPASSLVLTGDSCGATMAILLVQLILQLRRQQQTLHPKVRFNGQLVDVPMPAGVSGLSFGGDQLLCLPSYHRQVNIDNDMMRTIPPYRSPMGKVDAIWPTVPPRADIPCELSAMSSAVMNPCICSSWRDAPPMFLACGEERFADASKLLAQQATSQGVSVRFEEYGMMPHIFATNVPGIAQSKRCLQSWTDHIRQCVKGGLSEQSAVFVKPGKLETSPLDILRLVDFALAEAKAMMMAKQQTIRPWEGPEAKASL